MQINARHEPCLEGAVPVHGNRTAFAARGERHILAFASTSVAATYDREGDMHILWIILIGFVAGIIARFLAPGPNNPTGFVLTTAIGIAGAFAATYIGQMIGWYRLDQGAGLIGAIVGALIVLFIWHRLVATRTITDPGVGPRRWL
jgi:uncharacterized membrane protein YeaQ/YmgE (transglycosylase-associated protein family)